MELELDGFFLVGDAGGWADLGFVFPSGVEGGNVWSEGLFRGGEGEESFPVECVRREELGGKEERTDE